MAHDYELDRAHLDALLGAHAMYLGASALVSLVCDQPRLTAAHLAALVATQRTTHHTTASRYARRRIARTLVAK